MEPILTRLQMLAENKGIDILYACETGSRAWGFPSPDSDYDVRVIYKRDLKWYLSLYELDDFVEWMDGDFDITGWDLKKTLLLLKKSNVSVIERFQSPIQYMESAGFKEAFTDLVKHYYSPRAVFYHHYLLAVNFSKSVLNQESFTLKSFFYMVRSLLSCNWILKDNTVLPMHIEGLMQYVDEGIATELRKLIALKATVSESYFHAPDPLLMQWIKDMFATIELHKDETGVNNHDMSRMNEYFIKMLYGKADN